MMRDPRSSTRGTSPSKMKCGRSWPYVCAAPDLVQYDAGRQDLPSFLESLGYLVSVNNGHRITIENLAFSLRLEVTDTEAFVNLDVCGLRCEHEAARIVRQAVCVFNFRLIDG